jgi:hypothetical protein
MTGGENRRISFIKALRKRRIDHAVSYPFYYRGREKTYDIGFYNNLHQYSKNKIHCSCAMCSAKTRNKGNSKHKGMTKSINYKISDLRKIQKLSYVD